MTFAQIDFEVIQQLKGIQLSIFCAVRHEEYIGGGVCRLSPRELSGKYKPLSNYDSLCRHRKQMIRDGWLIEAVGGIITKSFNNTDISSVIDESDTDEISVTGESGTDEISVKGENTDEISVNSDETLTENQLITDEISGTGIALNKELKSLKEIDLKERERAHADAPDDLDFLLAFTETEIHKYFFPKYELSFSDKQTIRNRVRDKPAWIKALAFWKENNYRAESIGKQCTKHDEILQQENQPKNGKHQPNRETERERREREARERIEFFNQADQLLESARDLQIGGSQNC